MVLDQHFITELGKDFPKHVCGLFDDAGVRNGVDDASLSMGASVCQGKSEAGERLATAGGYGEGEKTGWQVRLAAALAEDVGAQDIDRRAGSGELGHVDVESLLRGAQAFRHRNMPRYRESPHPPGKRTTCVPTGQNRLHRPESAL